MTIEAGLNEFIILILIKFERRTANKVAYLETSMLQE